jgi:beta-N-acetylglucosaminidase
MDLTEEPSIVSVKERTHRRAFHLGRSRFLAAGFIESIKKLISSALCLTIVFTAFSAFLPRADSSLISAESLTSYEMNVNLNDYYQDTLDSSYYAWRGKVNLTGAIAQSEITGTSIAAYLDTSLIPAFNISTAGLAVVDGKYDFAAQLDTSLYTRGYHVLSIYSGTIAFAGEKTPILTIPVYFEYSEIATIGNVTTSCNMRVSATTESGIVAAVPLNASVDVLGEVTGQSRPEYGTNLWSLARYEDGSTIYTGYILSYFVLKMQTGISKMKVTAGDTPIQEFLPGKKTYDLNLPFSASDLSASDVALYNPDDTLQVLVNGVEKAPPYTSLPLITGDNVVEFIVTSEDALTSVTYTYNIWRIAESTEAEFQAQLARFPESYKNALQVLHSQYPNWLFVAFNTGLNWETVVSAHDSGSVSLIEISTPTEYKYSDVIMDGTSFVRASRAAVEYYLDPRNFFGTQSMFEFEQLTYQPTMHTLTGIQRLLAGSGLAGYEQMFLTAGVESGVSPYHLAARSRQEVTAWSPVGLSAVATGTYTGAGGIYFGLYNFYNIGTGSSTDTDLLVQRGLAYASGTNPKYDLPWNSALKAIVGGGKYIGANYISIGQDTLYLQKFDVDATNGLYNHEYMQNIRAPYHEALQSYNAYAQTSALSNSFVFRIPVYSNMPALSSPKPEDTNKLNSLAVTGYDFTSAFSSSSDTYSTTVPTNVDKITITASTLNSKATITGQTGLQSLLVGDNTFVIACNPSNGTTRNYTVHVTRTSPTKAANNLLGSLSITNGASEVALTPGFVAGHTGPFTVTVADTVAEITLTAAAEADTTVVTAGDLGAKTLSYGLNTLSVHVTAENAEVRTYTIQVTRSIPKAASPSFTLAQGIMSGVPLQTTAANLKAGMSPSVITYRLFSAAGVECPDTALVGTGMILRVYFGDTLMEEFTLLVYGDANGDGKVNSTDYAELKFHILKLKLLSGKLYDASDVNKDGKVNSTDYALMKFHILKLQFITQK